MSVVGEGTGGIPSLGVKRLPRQIGHAYLNKASSSVSDRRDKLLQNDPRVFTGLYRRCVKDGSFAGNCGALSEMPEQLRCLHM